MAKKTALMIATAMFLTISASHPAAADPFAMTYQGRLVDEFDGSPIAGPIGLTFRFYDDENGSNQLGSYVVPGEVALEDGVFSVEISLEPGVRSSIFGSSGDVWIEVVDTTNDRTYPPQKLTSVPYALRVPIDGASLRYNSDGELEVIEDFFTITVAGGDSSAIQNESIQSIDIKDGTITKTDLSSSLTFETSEIVGLDDQLSALSSGVDGKEPALGPGTSDQYYRGDKSWQTLDTDAVSEGTLNQYFTDARARGAISVDGGSPLSFDADSGVLSIYQSGAAFDGYLSAADWSTFNSKQDAIDASVVINLGTLTTNLQYAIGIKPFDDGAGGSGTGELRFYDIDSGGTKYVGFKAPNGVSVDHIWTLPTADGTVDQVLSTDGSGTLSWIANTQGSVTEITAGTGLEGGTITSTGTISLSSTGVSAGDYTRANISVDEQGRITSASNSPALDLAVDVTGALPIENGGTGATTISEARDALQLKAMALKDVVSSGDIVDGTVSSADIEDATIVNADIAADAAIADSKLAVIASAGKVANSATTALVTNTPEAIVVRDENGDFAAGTITASLNGNAATADSAFAISGVVDIANGGTGAENASDARTNLELGSLATLSSVTSSEITDATITTDDLADNAITSAKVANNSLTYNDIADGTIRSNELAADAVNSSKVLDNSLTADDIAAGAISTSEILNGTIVGADINQTTSLTIRSQEIRNAAGLAYVDFSNDNSTDFDVRLLLNSDDQIAIQGGGLSVEMALAVAEDMSLTGDMRDGGGRIIRESGGGEIRTYGATGWYNATYEGGWYMDNATTLKVHNDKDIETAGAVTSGELSTGSATIGGGVTVNGVTHGEYSTYLQSCSTSGGNWETLSHQLSSSWNGAKTFVNAYSSSQPFYFQVGGSWVESGYLKFKARCISETDNLPNNSFAVNIQYMLVK